MHQDMLRALTDEEVASYRDACVVCLEAMFDASWVSLLD
jgi:hypothetical protein